MEGDYSGNPCPVSLSAGGHPQAIAHRSVSIVEPRASDPAPRMVRAALDIAKRLALGLGHFGGSR